MKSYPPRWTDTGYVTSTTLDSIALTDPIRTIFYRGEEKEAIPIWESAGENPLTDAAITGTPFFMHREDILIETEAPLTGARSFYFLSGVTTVDLLRIYKKHLQNSRSYFFLKEKAVFEPQDFWKYTRSELDERTKYILCAVTAFRRPIWTATSGLLREKEDGSLFCLPVAYPVTFWMRKKDPQLDEGGVSRAVKIGALPWREVLRKPEKKSWEVPAGFSDWIKASRLEAKKKKDKLSFPTWDQIGQDIYHTILNP